MQIRDLIRIVEGRTVTLYHGTSVPALLDILRDGKLRGDLGVDEYGEGISFTLSLGIARQFAAQAEDYFWSAESMPGFGNAEFNKAQPQGAVLVFDQNMLAAHTSLRRIHWDGVATEREMRSAGDVILAWGLKGIRVRDGDLRLYADAMASHPDAFGDHHDETFADLLGHPLLQRD